MNWQFWPTSANAVVLVRRRRWGCHESKWRIGNCVPRCAPTRCIMAHQTGPGWNVAGVKTQRHPDTQKAIRGLFKVIRRHHLTQNLKNPHSPICGAVVLLKVPIRWWRPRWPASVLITRRLSGHRGAGGVARIMAATGSGNATEAASAAVWLHGEAASVRSRAGRRGLARRYRQSIAGYLPTGGHRRGQAQQRLPGSRAALNYGGRPEIVLDDRAWRNWWARFGSSGESRGGSVLAHHAEG